MIEWRTLAVIVILILAVADLALTYYYVYTYKKWQPDKPYNLIELNPLLRLLWNKLGFHIGMFVGAVIILALNYFISKEAHWAIVVVLFGILVFTMINHTNNIDLLGKLIEKYPSGYLPVETFGVVEGNNPK